MLYIRSAVDCLVSRGLPIEIVTLDDLDLCAIARSSPPTADFVNGNPLHNYQCRRV